MNERAEQMPAWIGPAANDSDQASDLMDSITDADAPDDYITRYLQSKDPENVRGDSALAMLLGRSYWRRVWIRDELAVAQTLIVMGGDRLMPWTTLEGACDMLPTDLLDPIVAGVSVYLERLQ